MYTHIYTHINIYKYVYVLGITQMGNIVPTADLKAHFCHSSDNITINSLSRIADAITLSMPTYLIPGMRDQCRLLHNVPVES